MKVLITGSEGFIGKHLCGVLLDDGHEVIGLDLKTGDDVVNCELPTSVDRVFHLAAQTDARSADAVDDARQNILTAVRIMHAYGQKVVFTSSAAVNYPNSPYAIAKLSCEYYARLYGCGVVRFCNIYGRGGHSFMDLYRDRAYVNANLPGDQIRTYAPVEFACDALLSCKAGELKVLPGVDLTVKQIVEKCYTGKHVHWFAQNKYDVIEGRQVYGF